MNRVFEFLSNIIAFFINLGSGIRDAFANLFSSGRKRKSIPVREEEPELLPEEEIEDAEEDELELPDEDEAEEEPDGAVEDAADAEPEIPEIPLAPDDELDDLEISYIDISADNTLPEKKKMSRRKKRGLIITLAAVLVVLLLLGTVAFYGVSAVKMALKASSYEYALQLLAKNIAEGNAEGMEWAAIASVSELKELDKQISYSRWNVIDTFSPEFKEDRARAKELIHELDSFTNDVVWTTIYFASNTSLTETINTVKTKGISAETADCITTYTNILDEVYDPTMDFLKTFDSMKEFNLSFFEEEVHDYRYPVKVAMTALPILKEASEEIAKPAADTIRTTPLEFPEKLSLDTLNGAFLSDVEVYTDLVKGLLDPAEKCMSELQALSEIPVPEKMEKTHTFFHSIVDHFKDKKDKEFDFEAAFDKIFRAIDETVPEISKYVPAVRVLFDRLIDPALETLQKYPPSGLKQDAGYNIRTVKAYLELAADLRADTDQITNAVYTFNSLGEGVSEKVNKVAGALEKFVLVYDRAEPYLPLLDVYLVDDGEYHFYLLTAQNSAEIRASGGFPGSIGRLAVTPEGYFDIVNFVSVWDVFALDTPSEVYPTATEDALFGGWLQLPRDADFDPHFPRVAEIWEAAAEERETVPYDGIISLTPAFVQKMMQLIEEDITLSDGTVLTKNNATKVLQHDLYFKYFGQDARNFNIVETDERNQQADALFSEAANSVIEKMFSDLDLDKLMTLIDIIEECRDDRTLMLWHEDEEKEDVIKDLDFDGGLNDDPEHPEIGVYYSCATSSKLGWFINIDVEVSDPVINDDGTRSYDVTASFTNTIDEESLKASLYIIGEDGGRMRSYIHFFAPAGGTISNATASDGYRLRTTEYQDLEVAYRTVYYIDPDETITFTFTVTTAEGVTEVPTVSQTPTLQDYR